MKSIFNLLSNALSFSSFFLVVFLISSCYSFKGISIPAEINTFNVVPVEVSAPEAPVGIQVTFQNDLIDKITQESRLSLNRQNPDLNFECTLTHFRVDAIGANANNQVDANRLTIKINVKYIDEKNEKNNWNSSFSQNAVFDAGVNLLSVQDELISQIFDALMEDIFNRAFANW